MMSSLTFGSPPWLWALLALPALAGLFAWAERRAGRRLARLLRTPRLRAQLTGAASAGRRRTRFGLLLAGMAGLILALAAPRAGYETRDTHRRGLDLIAVVDVSKSMLAADVAPNRLTRARLAVQDLAGMLEGDRLGLVAFAGTAFLQVPLTVDYGAILDSTNELDTDLIPRGGTNLGAALDLALDAFGKAEAGNRAILLLSDGEPTAEGERARGVEAARRAAEAGVRIFTVGIGTAAGALIPLDSQGNFVRDADGQLVKTKLDEGTLAEIARAANGFYTPFTTGPDTMRVILQQGLSRLKAGEIDARMARRPIERYQWPLGVGLLCLAGAATLGERRTARAPAGGGAARAVPVRRATAAAAAAGLAAMLLTAGALRAEDAPPAPPTGSALDLYQHGKYEEAYRAFEELAKKNPAADSLPFNAGASAYMGKRYDEALDAFAKSLTADSPSLQAKAHYNFGNTLFRRGEGQADPQARIKDWRNALEHYSSTLDTLKRGPSETNKALAVNTAYNRDVVQQRLDELLKQQQQDKKDKQDQQKKQDKPKQDKQDQQGKPDKQDKQDSKSDTNQGQPSPSPDGQPDPSKSGQPPESKEGQPAPDSNQPPEPKDGAGQSSPQPSPGPGQTPPEDQSGKSGQPTPRPGEPSKGEPNQPPDAGPGSPDQPRPRGDFQAQPGGESPSPTPGAQGEPSPAEAPEEAGKMSPAQARALLDSLRGEERHVNLGDPNRRQKPHDEPVYKDW